MRPPCRYCLAAYPTVAAETCEFEHRDEPRIYDLATAMARVFQAAEPTDEQVQLFLNDADAVADYFDPVPDRWRVHKLPDDFSEFVMRFQLNGVTYVVQDGDKEKTVPVRLATLRQWQREADEEAAARG